MLELSSGLGQVRGVIARETLGAVSPRQQVFAVEALMQRHQNAIKAVTKAATERHGGVMSADDAFRLVISEVEHATMALHWLQLVWLFKRLPAKGRPDLSVSKSRARRHQVLDEIKLACQIAGELMADLANVRTPNDTIERVFRKLELQILCVQISATRHARFSASERTPLSRSTLKDMLHELDVIRLMPGFAERSVEDQNLLWQTTALLCHELRDEDRERGALKERYALTSSSPDARAALLIETIDIAASDEEKFALVRELTLLPQTFDPGAPFSRERIGRLSMFRDGLWSATASVDVDSPFAGPITDEALACHRTWTFGQGAFPAANTVRVVSAWSGDGRVGWQSDGIAHTRPFELAPELAAAFTGEIDVMRPTDRGPIAKAMQFLDTNLGPLVAEAIRGKDEVRLQAGGPIALLPLLMTMLDDRPLGASANVAYAHPNPHVLDVLATTEPFELLIVDDCFGDDSAKVRSAIQLTAEQSSRTCRLLRFNSAVPGDGLEHDELEEALQSASRVLMFCHVGSPAAYAGETALITGASSRFRIDTLASLDLRALDELAIVGCASGRVNPFVGDISVAHAAAVAGARQVLYSLWPIRSEQGAGLVEDLVKARLDGQATVDFLAESYNRDRVAASPFAIMRP